MDLSLEGFALDRSKCNNLSTEGKRDLVHEILKWSDGAPEILQSWSRRDLLQILCAEMGKERKYTGVKKSKLIEHLLRIVSEKRSVKRKDGEDPESQSLPANNQLTSKRQRKTDKPLRLPISANYSMNDSDRDIVTSKYCQNLACRATLQQEDAFCKRCSCCICYQYDDNKDPSLWLVCSSESPYEGDSCGLSCHLECAIKHERAGISKDEHHKVLDGSFYCVFCGKVNDLLRCWRKQLMTAKDTRRVDVLCYRVSLSQKLLRGTKKYQKLNEIVEIAAKKLEAEVGPIAGLPVKMARGIVNRLSSGPDIQKLCASAVESLDMMLSFSVLPHLPSPKPQDSSLISPALISFENVNATSVTVVLGSNDTPQEENMGYTLWHRRANTVEYPSEPTCILFMPNSRFLLSDLSPASEYLVKVVPFNDAGQLGMREVTFTTSGVVDDVANTLVAERDRSPTTNSSSLSNPSSEGDESNNITAYGDRVNDPSGKEMQETPGDSVSVLDEERTTWELGSVHKLTDYQRNSTNQTIAQNVADIPKPENLLPVGQFIKEMSTSNGSNSSARKDMEIVTYEHDSNANLFITPSKPGIGDKPGNSARPQDGDAELHNGSGKPEKVTEVGSSTKKKSKARVDEECTKDGFSEDYVYCVKMIRRLECEGYLETNFRTKFLTWYSLRATPQDRRIVKVFVDTFFDDPVCLAGQLIDTFSEDVTNKRQPGVLSNGFCMRLFH